LLEGLDGVQKMSKSLGNYVGIAEAPGVQFGKVMSLPDALMPQYFELATAWPLTRADATREALARGELAPVDAKRLLARTVVELYHGAGAGEAAETEFDRVFKAHDVPSDIAEITVPVGEFRDGTIRVARLLALAFPSAVASNREGKRLIEQGGVRLDGERVEDSELALSKADVGGRLLQLGRRHWARLLSG
jgi:tyrosyl-tRNA synthetase